METRVISSNNKKEIDKTINGNITRVVLISYSMHSCHPYSQKKFYTITIISHLLNIELIGFYREFCFTPVIFFGWDYPCNVRGKNELEQNS
jgi:hypothetical protein